MLEGTMSTLSRNLPSPTSFSTFKPSTRLYFSQTIVIQQLKHSKAANVIGSQIILCWKPHIHDAVTKYQQQERPLLRQSLKKAMPQMSLRFSASSMVMSPMPVVQRLVACERGAVALVTSCSCTRACLSSDTLRWISVAASMLLLFVRDTGVCKTILMPLLALQLPRNAVTWIRGEYGSWIACLALAARCLYFIPGQLEQPVQLLLFLVMMPRQGLVLRAPPAATVVSLLMSSLLAYQHFGCSGDVTSCCKKGVVPATISILILLTIPTLLLLRSL